jgi:hypothetical protein
MPLRISPIVMADKNSLSLGVWFNHFMAAIPLPETLILRADPGNVVDNYFLSPTGNYFVPHFVPRSLLA